MDGRPLTGGSKQDNSPGGDHKRAPDVRCSPDEPETPDSELLALMRTGRDYLRLTELRDDSDSGRQASSAGSRSPPPPPHPPGPATASTATHTPAGTSSASIQGPKKGPGTLSLFPDTRPSPTVPAKQPLTQEAIDDYWSSGPMPKYPPPRPSAAFASTKDEPESPNPTTPLSSGGTRTSVPLPPRPSLPKQEVSTPASHKRNKSHGDHLNSAIHTRLPASPSPRPRPLSGDTSIPTPTRPPPPPPIEAPVKPSGTNTDSTPA
ncbi:hypothetical protein QBC40DRAFT_300110 [Triangularia verruculosa]|uniref:Uncharacterized protein n=1 Tax=Triangularia verruculosa TaxID=2587418 RepID=A0AAN7APS3_9PEZI|nr:hypothetical protein QBC40DRAFT_300110 [Triangularia verruculosa]